MLEVGYVYKDDMAGDEQTRHVACSFNMGMLAMAIGVGDLDRIGILDVLKRVEIHIANLGYQDANFFKHDLEEEKGDYCSIEKWNRSNEFFTWDDLLDVDFWLTLRRNDWGSMSIMLISTLGFWIIQIVRGEKGKGTNWQERCLMSKVKRYLIICLKRSEVFDNNTYWRPMRSGYTKDKMEAGYYRAEDLDDCAGSEGDWVAMPVWISTEKLIGQIMIMDENGRYFR